MASTAYNHPWYNGSQSYKKSILIIMIRSQRALELDAYGLRTIRLEAFQMVSTITQYEIITFQHM